VNLSIVQNFVINKKERFDVLAADIIYDIGNFFEDCDFYINYNSEKNFDKVYSLYKKHIDKLSFYNDLTLDWGKIIQSILSEIKTDYVFIFPEDFKLCIQDKEYFKNLMEEFVDNDCKFMLMHRIDNVKCYGTNEKYFHLYDTKKTLHLVNSENYPGSCLSSVAIYKKDFLNEFLTFYNNSSKSERFPLATPNCYEWFSHNRTSDLIKNELFAIPKKPVIVHHEPHGTKERI
jgi:hypothetical protein